MSKSYRALAIVAVVATLVSIGLQLTSPHVSLDSGMLSAILLRIWIPTSTLAAPVLSTLGVIVAAQARRWGWLVAFILLGLFAIYGPEMLLFLEPYLGIERPLRVGGLDVIAPELLPLVLLAIVALVFVASARPRQPAVGLERPALP